MEGTSRERTENFVIAEITRLRKKLPDRDMYVFLVQIREAMDG